MSEETEFLQAIQGRPKDDTLLLVYADWLEERGDTRAELLRLRTLLKSLDPDHLQRPAAEHRLSYLRRGIDPRWLALIEPEHLPQEHDSRHSCRCIEVWHQKPPFSESRLHTEAQDTECDAWKRLLDLVEEAAADGRSDFEPRAVARDLREWSQIVTLPPTIAKLKEVKKLWLYGSQLVRIPPEIGEMTNLEEFDPYTSYWLHWFPYEITRCKNLKRSRVSTRALYGNYKYRPPFPGLHPESGSPRGSAHPVATPSGPGPLRAARNCSVCNQPYHDLRLHRVWISLRVATDVLPLLVNACSEECIQRLPRPPQDYVPKPHRGGLGVQQPPTER